MSPTAGTGEGRGPAGSGHGPSATADAMSGGQAGD
eukprot:CAMPEP_0182595154 /NCGR_PEP_ID=MMETSP1324-20130603/81714_1 /TAXON_ID=236786 /ORGANISM="Florenciella sp., Strain RCC1587" /LENGTH=34 /DNA_ID= /DNA_START= /DNA_END= /DNA_ORIENTATION=